MTTQTAQAHREKLTSMEVPEDQAEAILDRVRDVLGYHVARINGTQTLAEQMKALAFDAYTQGLLDGSKITRDIRNVILRA